MAGGYEALQVKGNPSREAFESWLREQGADVLAPTNPYEFARFRAHGGVHVIYVRQTGTFSAQEFGLECLAAFRRGASIAMGFTAERKTYASAVRATLIKRDGGACFFCGQPMQAEDITVEHLVAKARGGPDHTDNLVLAHERCNKEVGAMPLIEKIRIHVDMKIAKFTGLMP
jgi:hypothetical protein